MTIMNHIADLLATKVVINKRHSAIEDRRYLHIAATSRASLELVIKYFSLFPLISPPVFYTGGPGTLKACPVHKIFRL